MQRRDMGDERAVMVEPALGQVAASLGKGGVQGLPGAQVAKLHQAGAIRFNMTNTARMKMP